MRQLVFHPLRNMSHKVSFQRFSTVFTIFIIKGRDHL